MQENLELDIVSGSGVGHGTPNFAALSERSNYRRDSQSTVAGPPSCASVALRRRLEDQHYNYLFERLPKNKGHCLVLAGKLIIISSIFTLEEYLIYQSGTLC